VAIYLGIDGGGSKTHCLVGDERALLARGTGAGSNVVRVGETRARESLEAAVQQACTAAKVSPQGVRRTCVGMSGAGRPETGEVVRRIVEGLVSGEVEVVGDMETAFEAAFPSRPGVIVIAGTGSIAYGKNAEGRTTRAGGWGFAISDEGSGHWIGRAAVAAAMRAYGEVESRELLERLMNFWDVGTGEQMVLKANSYPPPDFAALLPVVLAAAESGEPLARKVLVQAGVELASLTGIAIGRLFSHAGNVPVAMSGGVFRHCALVRETFSSELSAEFPQAEVRADVIDPAWGALELARRNDSQ
jgi:glucosamine kinase